MSTSADQQASAGEPVQLRDFSIDLGNLADARLDDLATLRPLSASVTDRLTEVSARLIEVGGRITPLQVRAQKRVRKALKDVVDGICFGPVAGAVLGEAIALIDDLSDALESLDALDSLDLQNAECTELAKPDAAIAAALLSEVRRERLPHGLADMSLRAMESLGDRQALISRVASGMPPGEAAKELPSGRTMSARWARRILHGHREHGVEALIDSRIRNGRKPLISAAAILATLAIYFTRSCATPRAIREQLMLSLPKGENIPSASWIRDLIARLPAHLRSVRNRGKDEWRRNTAPRGRLPKTEYANEVAEMDHCCLDIWVKERSPDGSWVAAQPYLTAALDVHSRGIAGMLVSTEYPNAWSVLLTLRAAILPKADERWLMQGAMDRLRIDLGKDFISAHVKESAAALGITLELCDAHAPNQKPYIERFFRTLQGRLLVRLAGYKGAGMKSQEAAQKRVDFLLTLEQLRCTIRDWIVQFYNVEEHGGLSQQHQDPRPNAVWLRTARVRAVAERDLDVLLLKSKTRSIQRQGISIDGRTYASPELADRVGEEVEVRHHPEEWDVAIVYSTSKGHAPVIAYWVESPNAQYTTEEHAQQRTRISKIIDRTMRWAANASETLEPRLIEAEVASDVASALVGDAERRPKQQLWQTERVSENECEIEEGPEDPENDAARRQFLKGLSLPAALPEHATNEEPLQ